MKVQCSCGAKYEFDIAPAMVKNPVRFVCPACGVDASEFVDSLVRQELGQTATPPGVPQPVFLSAAPAAPVRVPLPSPPAAARPAVAVRVQAPAPVAEAVPAAAPTPQLCSKHGEPAVEKCYLCSKPICPKCMALFGYVCSPLCKAKAESHGVNVPIYEGQKSLVEARYWRKVGWIATSIGGFILALLGVWFWFAWFGSEPKPVFSVRFPEPAYSGRVFGSGKDQIIFLHGGTLARHDLKSKKVIWTRELLDRKQVEAEASQWLKDLQAAAAQEEKAGSRSGLKTPSLEKLIKRMEKSAAAELELRVRGQNIWVSSPGKLVRYDWETGNPAKEIPVQAGFGGLIARGDELVLVDTDSAKPLVTHINLATSETRTEELGGSAAPALAAAGGNSGSGTNSSRSRVPGASGLEMAGLPSGTGKDAGKIMDPVKVAQQAQHLSYPAKLALPATLAANLNQERAMAEMNDEDSPRPALPALTRREPEERASLIPSKDGFVQVSVRLVESRIVERSAMKAPPKKSALEGNLTAGNTMDAANEMLNEIQRTRGGDIVEEDLSRYRVTLRNPGEKESWSGEVIGPPSLYPLQTVNVLTANKMILVLDKANKKLWESSLSYNVQGDLSALDADTAPYGQGPCVERNGVLYVFDEGVLTAFELANGNARWRLPSVGIAGLFFDDREIMYVNSTTASPESIKYSARLISRKKPGCRS